MFIYFLQRKFFLDNGDGRYLQNKLAEMQKKGPDLYYERFLKVLFFEGFRQTARWAEQSIGFRQISSWRDQVSQRRAIPSPSGGGAVV